jgi:hypothetical protein
VLAARTQHRGGGALGAAVARRARAAYLRQVSRRPISQLLEGAPAVHLRRVSCRGWLLDVPGAYGTATAAPTEPDVPTGNTTHRTTDVITLSEAPAELCDLKVKRHIAPCVTYVAGARAHARVDQVERVRGRAW